MANSLIKSKSYTPAVSGRPYIAAQPARDVWQVRQVCGYKMVVNHLVPGHYQFVTDPHTNQVTAIYVPDKIEGNSITQVSEYYYAYTCWPENVLTRVPATQGQEAVAAVPAKWDYKLGWDAGARSLMFVMGDCGAFFQAPSSNVGAICGLNGHEEPLSYNGMDIRFGFHLSRGYARVMERGVARTSARPYSSSTVFKVTRTGSEVNYSMDGNWVYTSTDMSSGNDPLWLQAALYSGDDEIFNPRLEQYSELDVSTPLTGTLTLTLPPARVAARRRAGAVLKLALSPTMVKGSEQVMEIPSFSVLNLSLPAARPSMYGLLGVVGTLNLGLSAPRITVAERNFGRLSMKLAAPWLYARTWPADELPAGSGRLVLKSSSSLKAVVTLPTAAMRLEVGGLAQPYVEVTLESVKVSGALLLGGDMAAMSEVTLPLEPMRAVLGGSITVLTGLNEVFCMSKAGVTTRYESYEFNSYMRLNGKSYGANSQGLFLLEGADDAGQPINASFGFGQQDFGSPQLKTASYCYLGAAAGAMSVNIEALLNGNLVAYDYPARGHGQSMREVRFDLGRGLRSAYLTPTFSNVDGAPFEVDAVRFVIHESARRI